MKNLFPLAFAAIVLVSCNTDNSTDSTKNTELKSQIDSVSYALGINIGNQFTEGGLDSLNVDALAAGVRDVIDSNEMKLTPAQSDAVVEAFFESQRLALIKKNRQEGAAVLEENRKQKNIKETESGIQYTIIEEGKGNRPSPEDSIIFHIEESLADGESLGGTRSAGMPIRAKLTDASMFEAWKEVIALMKEGAVYKIWLPAEHAYGDQGSRSGVQGGQLVVHEIELVEVK